MLVSTIFAAFAASLSVSQASAVDNGRLPVYLLNGGSSFHSNEYVEADLVPALISHFLGDDTEALTADNEEALMHIPSRFLDPRGATVLVVDNFDVEKAEDKLGSANFYISDVAAQLVAARATKIPIIGIFRAEKGNEVFRVDAVHGDRSSTDFILAKMKSYEGLKTMIIGIPPLGKSERLPDSHSIVRSSDNNETENLPYIKIPSSFGSEEECFSKTNGCSSHGSCVKTSRGDYSCQCKPTKVGDYTYYWGGNDCSKRDVSFQFNLIVGVTLAIIVAAALSVKLLFNLGSEPLPGVLDVTSI